MVAAAAGAAWATAPGQNGKLVFRRYLDEQRTTGALFTANSDGRWIAFSRTPGTGEDGKADVFVMRANGTGARNVTRSGIWDSAVEWGSR